ncbi:MAG TPA: response regulator transcription factor [Bryobacteraceae bacterium]|nr:response regulator transcription factor [Bryobacteraceae bacterium]
MITVLLADDHALVRRGFRRMLEDESDMQVVGEASNGMEAVEQAVRLVPQVVVMDYAMPGLDGVQATAEIRKQAPQSAVLMLSMQSDENYILNEVAAGARGYLLKNAVDVDLAGAVRTVAAGQRYGVPPETAINSDPDLDRLTARERQILQLLAQGNSAKDVANLLGVSPHTVAAHRANLMETLGIHKTAELVLYAIRKGLVSPR